MKESNAHHTGISTVVVLHNGAAYVRALTDSLQAQTQQVDEVIVVDNGSTDDGLIQFLTAFPSAKQLRFNTNTGFDVGYNRGIGLATNPFVLILNQDLVLNENAVELLYTALLQRPQHAAVTPKMLRLENSVKTCIIDSMGIGATRARRFYNIGEGKRDVGQYDFMSDIFGASGAAVLFRMEALRDVAEKKDDGSADFFDENFFAYKEDVDLSYRLRHRGWGIAVIPDAILYHHRGVKDERACKGVRVNRKQRSERVNMLSWRNHIWTILKNEPMCTFLVSSPFILTYEFGKLLYMLVLEPGTLRSVAQCVRGLRGQWHKRRANLQRSVISHASLRRWFRGL